MPSHKIAFPKLPKTNSCQKTKEKRQNVENILSQFKEDKQRRNSMIQPLQSINQTLNFKTPQEPHQSSIIVHVKRLEAYEKDAIRLFYQKKYAECFEILQKCLQILKAECNNASDHQIYIYYLYVEFMYKLQDYESSQSYAQKATQLYSRLSKHKLKSKDYMLCVQALKIALEVENTSNQALDRIQQFQSLYGPHELNQKALKIITNAKIQALMNIGSHKQAHQLCCQQQKIFREKQCGKHDLAKLVAKKIACLNEINPQEALELLRNAIFKQKAKEYLMQPNFTIFFGLLQDAGDLLGQFYLCQIWKSEVKSIQDCAAANIRLYRLHYQLGDYERAQECLMSAIENAQQEQQLQIGDYRILAQIKLFNGERREALEIYLKCLQLCQTQEEKTSICVQILQSGEDQGLHDKELERAIEKIIATIRQQGISTIQEKTLLNQYTAYLQRQGHKDKTGRICAKQLR